MIFRKDKHNKQRLWKRNVRQENEKYWKYQLSNKFEKIFIKSCKKMKKGKVREENSGSGGAT